MAIKLKDLKKALEKTFDDTVKEMESRQNMTILGKSLADDIRKRTRLGYGVTKDGGTREKLKPLAKSTIAQRQGKLAFRKNDKGKTYPISSTTPNKETNKRNKRFLQQNKPTLAATTKPTKSNLTSTGRMLRSIGVLYTGAGKITLGFNTQIRARIAAYVSKARPFFFATKLEEKRVDKKASKMMNEILDKNKRKYDF